MSNWTEEEKEEVYRREEEEDREQSSICPDCGTQMRYEVISTDADGNRAEYGYVCSKCD